MTKPLFEHLNILNVGAAGDVGYNLSSSLKKMIRLGAIDAAGDASFSPEEYADYLPIKKVISGKRESRQFHVYEYQTCSSILKPNMTVVNEYGLSKFVALKQIHEVDCVTVEDIVSEAQWSKLDFLKTDAEGMDFEIIKGAGDTLLKGLLGIQAELRFQPYFEGEPYFHEVAQYLHHQGFQLIGMQPQIWKPVTSRQKEHQEGRLAWADCFFVKTLDQLRKDQEHLKENLAKQIVICALAGYRSHGEFLLESNGQLFDLNETNFLGEAVAPAHRPGGRKEKLKQLWREFVSVFLNKKTPEILPHILK